MKYRLYFLCPLLITSGCVTVPSVDSSLTYAIGPFDKVDAALHQAWIQERLDNSGLNRFLFAPGEYHLTSPSGLRIPDGVTLLMDGASFILSEELSEDGQAFLLESVSNIVMKGGAIIGARETWDPGTNIAGVRVVGKSSNIHIDNLFCKNLSSNAIGVFGGEGDHIISNVHLTHITGINCCNTYVDYLQPNKGPVPGSEREDQGTVAFYHVDGWSVDTSHFEDSQSDGTHFYHCTNGQFTNNTVSGSAMGGYFLEGCENISASGNLICDNGSRGVTIERNSQYCTLSNNIIRHSGREGLWMPDVRSIIVSGNLFIENGRKDHGEMDCEIRLDDAAEYDMVTGGVRIAGNIFQTSAHQTAVIYISGNMPDVAEINNSFLGEAVPNILIANNSSE